MINRESKIVQVVSYTNTLDEYGQSRKTGHTTRNTEMTCKIYMQNNTTDIRYVDVEMIGITKDTAITDANAIVIDNQLYNVLYVIPSNRYTQVLMKKAYESWNN